MVMLTPDVNVTMVIQFGAVPVSWHVVPVKREVAVEPVGVRMISILSIRN